MPTVVIKRDVFFRLQGRMEQMRRFRRQHEQLRAVIMRVLGPNLQALPAASGGDGDRSEQSDLVSCSSHLFQIH